MLVDLSSDDRQLHLLSRELRTICQAMGNDHRQGIEALGAMLARLKGFVENTPHVAIQGFDRHGVIQLWNVASAELYGYSVSEAIGRRLQDLLLEAEAAREFEQTLCEIWDTHQATPPQEWPVYTRHGEARWVYSTMFPAIEHGVVIGVICVDVDITTRKQADEALKQACDQLESRVAERTAALQRANAQLQAEISERERTEEALRSSRRRLWALATHLQDRQEEERRRIARDIHDELAQAFTSMKIDVSWLSKRLTTGQEDMQDRLTAMKGQLDELFDAVHRIGTALRPSILDHMGLLAAIEGQLQDVRRRTGLPYSLTLPPGEMHLEPARATAVFRIFQEAITNVLRHAKASYVSVDLVQGADGIRLHITDNGKGMQPDQLPDRGSFGMLGMRERAQLWDGDVTVCSRPGSGTTVTVYMPYQQEEDA